MQRPPVRRQEEEEDEEEEEEDDEDEDEDDEDDDEQQTHPVRIPENQSILDASKGLLDASKGMSALDRMTLELMMPKHAYNRYLSQNEPAQYEEKQRFAQKVRRYRHDIERAMQQCLDKLMDTTLQEDFMMTSQGVNPDSLACVEQVCKVVINDIEVQRSASEEMFSKVDHSVTRYSLDNFDWRQHGTRVHKR